MVKAAPKIGYSLITAAVLGAGALATALPAQGSTGAPQSAHQASTHAGAAAPRAAFTRTLTADLKATGFQVNPGYPMLLTADACEKYLYPALKNCFGNNPASTYVIPVVKAWPHEHVGPSPVDAFGPVDPGYTPFFRMDRRDAIVVYGQMPPPGKYMSLQTYQWSQPGQWKAKDYNQWAHTANRPYPMQYLFETIPPNDPHAGRTWSFSSLGGAVNNVVMQQQSGAPWGKNRYFIITPSKSTDQAMRRALQAQGVPGGDIFTEQIPSRDTNGQIGPLGMGKNAIDFWSTFKEAIPTNPAAAQQWWAHPPLTVLRVRAPSSLGPVHPYGMLTYPRQTAHSEAYLAGDLHNLTQAVCNRTSSTAHLRSTDCTQPPPASSVIDWFSLTEPYCRPIHMWCSENGHEGTGVVVRPLPLDSGQVYAMVSTLATETGNATYVGLSVNDASRFSSPTGVTDATLKGSADSYAATVDNTSKFFVHYFTRDCSTLADLLGDRLEQDCTPITTDMVPPKWDTHAQGHPALRGKIMLILRDYTMPGTPTGTRPSWATSPPPCLCASDPGRRRDPVCHPRARKPRDAPPITG